MSFRTSLRHDFVVSGLLLIGSAVGCQAHVVLEEESFFQGPVTAAGQAGSSQLPGLGSIRSSDGAGGTSTGGVSASAPSAGGSEASAGLDGLGGGGGAPMPGACQDVVCDDDILCTQDRCEPTTGLCTFDPSACTCSVGTQLTDCNDDNPCTLDRCVNLGCSNLATLGAPCDDGVECTSDDACQSDGSCAGSEETCVVEPPETWTCEGERYGDGTCDCGCGVVDVDCAGPEAAKCESCQCGTCTESGDACDDVCPVLPMDNATCGWLCPAFLYGNGQCTCGCGVVDADCASLDAEACEFSFCDAPVTGDRGVVETNNALCVNPPPVAPEGWICAPQFFGNGICDCGCGVLDSDCNSRARSQCQFCVCADVAPLSCPVANADNTQCLLP